MSNRAGRTRARKTPRRGLLIVISGPSGAGKSTIVHRILRPLGLKRSVSATTRPRRKGEADRKDYYFLSRKVFERWIAAGQFLEYAEYNGELYGTPKAAVEQALARGKDMVLEIEVQGARKVRAACPDALTLFVSPPDLKTAGQRLVDRRRGEDEAEIERRLNIARREMRRRREFDAVVVNKDLDKAVAQTERIIREARKQRAAKE